MQKYPDTRWRPMNVGSAPSRTAHDAAYPSGHEHGR